MNRSTVVPSVDPALIAVLEESQRLGFLGARPIPDVIEHARHFVAPILDADGSDSVLDLGSGGGIPGLVIAHDVPRARVTLLDRRQTRTDFLARMIRRLQWHDRVEVLHLDATNPDPTRRGAFKWVVARGFGPPLKTLEIACEWVDDSGAVLISEPPAGGVTGDRWGRADLDALGLVRRATDLRVAWFERRPP